MAAGKARRVTVSNLQQLAEQLCALKSDQAVGWGVSSVDEATIVQQEDDDGTDPFRISRTRRNFAFAKGPGIMMLDHDGTPDDDGTERI